MGGEIIPESGSAIISEQRGGFIGIGTHDQNQQVLPGRRSEPGPKRRQPMAKDVRDGIT
jgi:hypothetical protein